MNGFSFLIMIMATGNLLVTWLDKSMADGKITILEAAVLVDGLGSIWGFSVELPIPKPKLLSDDDSFSKEQSGHDIAEEQAHKIPHIE